MLQFYLNLEGLLLPWVGTGRFIFPIDLDGATFERVTERFVNAGRAMQRDGWWDGPELGHRQIGRMVLKESLAAVGRKSRKAPQVVGPTFIK
jgi:glutamate-1-semialdehyde 2,1-aminomutase